MKKNRRAFLLFLIIVPGLCFGATSWKRMPNLRRYPIPQAINKIIKNWLGDRMVRSHIGIIIQSMKTGKILYRRNSAHLFTSASVQKTLAATAALYYLKPNFTFDTKLLMHGKISHHVLKGDLYLKFSGDPDFTDTDLDQLVHQLKKRGIRKITGHIYIDATDYGNIPYPPGWVWDDLSYSFAAPLMTTIINRNYFTLILKTPGSNKRHPLIETNLPHDVVTFSNDLMVDNRLPANCPIGIYSNANNHYILRGCYYRRWKQQVRKIAIRDVPRYARVLLRNSLRDNHIAYYYPIAFRSAPRRVQLIVAHQSPPLYVIIKEMLKDSDNLMTNAVFKKLGETYFRSRGTWQNSLKALKAILAKPTGINFNHNLVNDGAGLSRYNLLAPKQLAKVLYFAYHNKTIKKSFINALPIGGKDGTLEYRMQDLRRGRRVHLKTGSMTGVSALAGYIYTKHRGVISFVIMINGFVKPKKPYFRLEDDICRYLVSAYAHG